MFQKWPFSKKDSPEEVDTGEKKRPLGSNQKNTKKDSPEEADVGEKTRSSVSDTKSSATNGSTSEVYNPKEKSSAMRSPKTRTLGEAMKLYDDLLQRNIGSDVECLYLLALQSQHQIIEKLLLEKTNLQEELNRSVEMQKENNDLRAAISKNRLEMNYRPIGPSGIDLMMAKHQEEVNKLHIENSQLKKDCDELREKLKELGDENSKLKENSQHESKKTEETFRSLTDAVDVQLNQISALKKENSKLQNDIQRLKNPPSSSWKRAPNPPPLPSVTFQLVSKQVLSHGDVLRQLETQLTASLWSAKVKANCLLLESASDVRPLLVVCLRALRLGTDVNEALNGINRDESVALIVLHHQGSHVRHYDVTEKQLSSEISGLGLIADTVFWKEQGLYSCETNNSAIARLTSFLVKFAK